MIVFPRILIFACLALFAPVVPLSALWRRLAAAASWLIGVEDEPALSSEAARRELAAVLEVRLRDAPDAGQVGELLSRARVAGLTDAEIEEAVARAIVELDERAERLVEGLHRDGTGCSGGRPCQRR